MRTVLTSEDVKNIIEGIFKENTEPLVLVDEEGGKTEVDFAQYLNIRFYTWKERLVKRRKDEMSDAPYSLFDEWVQSLNFSLNQAYALVELVDEEITASQDIDSATKIGRVTFVIQSDKIKNLDWYITKLRNKYIGNPQQIQNSFGDTVATYLLLGTMTYDEEPTTLQYGECMRVSCGFRLSYLNDALNYSDVKVEISLDGDDVYNADGEIVGETKYLQMPLTRQTWQTIFTSNAVPTSTRPDLTGFVATALSSVKTLTFFDYNKALSKRFNSLFWSMPAYRIDGKLTQRRDVNVPVYLRVTVGGHSYVYKDMLDNMEMVITNSDFNVCSVTLKGWGKLGVEEAIE